MAAAVDWSDLPKEIWPIIGKFLHTRIDILRFRSVCSLWRSSRPPFQRPPPPPPLPLKFSAVRAADPRNQALLFYSTTYRMEPLPDNNNNNRGKGGTSITRPWLMKLEHNPSSDEMRLLHPLSCSPLRSPRNSNRKEFSLLDFHVEELRKSYVLKFGKNSRVNVKTVNKLVVMPGEFVEFSDVTGIFMIYNSGKLGFVRFGDDRLTRVDENAHYDDIIVYKGLCYVVDKWGTISWVSSGLQVIELQVIQFSPPLCGFGGQKYLVESCGDLYVVDQFFEKVSYRDNVNMVLPQIPENELMFFHPNRNRHDDADTTGFRVYKLDQEWGRWVDVKDLADYIFILSSDGSFSVSSREFGGVKGNCIFFTESVVSNLRTYNRVFSLEDGRISSLASSHSQMFDPPTSWLCPD